MNGAIRAAGNIYATGNLTIDGNTRLKTSLSGLLQASSGKVGTASIIIQSSEPSTTGRTDGDIWVEL